MPPRAHTGFPTVLSCLLLSNCTTESASSAGILHDVQLKTSDNIVEAISLIFFFPVALSHQGSVC